MGDPEYFNVPLGELLSIKRLNELRSSIDSNKASTVNQVYPYLPRKESKDTTHYSIIDQWGNAVSNTYTINWAFGSGVVIRGAGFLLNNEMDDFSAKPGVPNIYGVIGSSVNEIQSGKRPLSSMSPTILLEGNEVMLVVGTPGGSTIFTSVFQTVINIIDSVSYTHLTLPTNREV